MGSPLIERDKAKYRMRRAFSKVMYPSSMSAQAVAESTSTAKWTAGRLSLSLVNAPDSDNAVVPVRSPLGQAHRATALSPVKGAPRKMKARRGSHCMCSNTARHTVAT